jgi:CheY-like chemotaxis protein
VTFRFGDLSEMQHAMTIAGARMALRVDDEQHPSSAQWALALFEIATGKRATAAAGRVVTVGEETYIEFDRRDWDRLTEFAAPWSTTPRAENVDEPPESTPRQAARAVVVEDERVSREMVTSFLLGLGLVVRPASTAEHALELFDRESFDMAVLDLALPGMSGLELCEAIRSRTDSLQSLPILILTADSSDDMAKRSFRAGADDFITKPVPVLEFRARVLALLRRGRGSLV